MATPTYPDKPNTPSAQSGGKPSFQITGMKDAATSNTSDSDKALSKLGNIDYKKAAQANVPESQTAAGRLDKMLGSDSPLMKRAATQGKQMANNRGLLNSSMSAGAAQGAMIDRAQPFALQDSNNFFSQAQFNASQTNQMRGQWNQAMTQGALQDSGNAFNENQFNAQQQNALGQQYNDLLGRAQLAEQQYEFQHGLNEQGYWQDLGRMQQGFNLDMGKMQADFGFSSQLATQEAEQTLNQLYATSTANAWGVMANNLTDIVGQYSAQLERIQTNPDIEEADKTKLIEQVLTMRDTDIGFQKSLYEQLPTYLANTNVFPNR